MIEIPTHDPKLHQQWWRDVQGIRFDDDTPQIPRFDSRWALRILSRDDIHPGDVFASVHPTRNAALLCARANREAHGHPTLGVAHVDPLGWVSVIDLRPSLAALGCPPHPVP